MREHLDIDNGRYLYVNTGSFHVVIISWLKSFHKSQNGSRLKRSYLLTEREREGEREGGREGGRERESLERYLREIVREIGER